MLKHLVSKACRQNEGTASRILNVDGSKLHLFEIIFNDTFFKSYLENVRVIWKRGGETRRTINIYKIF
jgi:hypothetical protein